MEELLEKAQVALAKVDNLIREEIKLQETNDGVFVETSKYIKLMDIRARLSVCVDEIIDLVRVNAKYDKEGEMTIQNWLLWILGILVFIALCILV